MNAKNDNPELKAAVRWLVEFDNPVTWTSKHTTDYRKHSATLVRHGFCPACVAADHLSELLPRTPATRDEYGGRTCPDCDEFFLTGDQEVDDGTCEEWHSDAYPGL